MASTRGKKGEDKLQGLIDWEVHPYNPTCWDGLSDRNGKCACPAAFLAEHAVKHYRELTGQGTRKNRTNAGGFTVDFSSAASLLYFFRLVARNTHTAVHDDSEHVDPGSHVDHHAIGALTAGMSSSLPVSMLEALKVHTNVKTRLRPGVPLTVIMHRGVALGVFETRSVHAQGDVSESKTSRSGKKMRGANGRVLGEGNGRTLDAVVSANTSTNGSSNDLYNGMGQSANDITDLSNANGVLRVRELDGPSTCWRDIRIEFTEMAKGASTCIKRCRGRARVVRGPAFDRLLRKLEGLCHDQTKTHNEDLESGTHVVKQLGDDDDDSGNNEANSEPADGTSVEGNANLKPEGIKDKKSTVKVASLTDPKWGDDEWLTRTPVPLQQGVEGMPKDAEIVALQAYTKPRGNARLVVVASLDSDKSTNGQNDALTVDCFTAPYDATFFDDARSYSKAASAMAAAAAAAEEQAAFGGTASKASGHAVSTSQSRIEPLIDPEAERQAERLTLAIWATLSMQQPGIRMQGLILEFLRTPDPTGRGGPMLMLSAPISMRATLDPEHAAALAKAQLASVETLLGVCSATNKVSKGLSGLGGGGLGHGAVVANPLPPHHHKMKLMALPLAMTPKGLRDKLNSARERDRSRSNLESPSQRRSQSARLVDGDVDIDEDVLASPTSTVTSVTPHRAHRDYPSASKYGVGNNRSPMARSHLPPRPSSAPPRQPDSGGSGTALRDSINAPGRLHHNCVANHGLTNRRQQASGQQLPQRKVFEAPPNDEQRNLAAHEASQWQRSRQVKTTLGGLSTQDRVDNGGVVNGTGATGSHGGRSATRAGSRNKDHFSTRPPVSVSMVGGHAPKQSALKVKRSTRSDSEDSEGNHEGDSSSESELSDDAYDNVKGRGAPNKTGSSTLEDSDTIAQELRLASIEPGGWKRVPKPTESIVRLYINNVPFRASVGRCCVAPTAFALSRALETVKGELPWLQQRAEVAEDRLATYLNFHGGQVMELKAARRKAEQSEEKAINDLVASEKKLQEAHEEVVYQKRRALLEQDRAQEAADKNTELRAEIDKLHTIIAGVREEREKMYVPRSQLEATLAVLEESQNENKDLKKELKETKETLKITRQELGDAETRLNDSLAQITKLQEAMETLRAMASKLGSEAKAGSNPAEVKPDSTGPKRMFSIDIEDITKGKATEEGGAQSVLWRFRDQLGQLYYYYCNLPGYQTDGAPPPLPKDGDLTAERDEELMEETKMEKGLPISKFVQLCDHSHVFKDPKIVTKAHTDVVFTMSCRRWKAAQKERGMNFATDAVEFDVTAQRMSFDEFLEGLVRLSAIAYRRDFRARTLGDRVLMLIRYNLMPRLCRNLSAGLLMEECRAVESAGTLQHLSKRTHKIKPGLVQM